jgi:hypothetical protein
VRSAAFEAGGGHRNVAFQHDLGAGRHLQHSGRLAHRVSATSVRLPRSRPANWYSDRLSGTGVTAPRMVAGSAPSATAIGNGWPGLASATSLLIYSGKGATYNAMFGYLILAFLLYEFIQFYTKKRSCNQ